MVIALAFSVVYGFPPPTSVYTLRQFWKSIWSEKDTLGSSNVKSNLNWIEPQSKQQPLLMLERNSSEMQVRTYKTPLFKCAKKLLSISPVRDTWVFPVQTVWLGNTPTILCFIAQPINSFQPPADWWSEKGLETPLLLTSAVYSGRSYISIYWSTQEKKNCKANHRILLWNQKCVSTLLA